MAGRAERKIVVKLDQAQDEHVAREAERLCQTKQGHMRYLVARSMADKITQELDDQLGLNRKYHEGTLRERPGPQKLAGSERRRKAS